MVSLGHGVRPEVRPRYRHMMPEDTLIWTRFLYGKMYLPDVVWYDVRVGMPLSVPVDRPEWMRRYVDYSTRKRIDVVGRKGLDYWVIECKPNAGCEALGQAIFYSHVFMQEYQPAGEVIPCVVTDRVDHDVRSVFDFCGVVVIEVGDFPELEKWQSGRKMEAQ